MSNLKSWVCDGVASNGNTHNNSLSPHEPHENYGPDCVICGLPRSAKIGEDTTIDTKPPWLIPGLAVGGVVVLLGLVFGGYKIYQSATGQEQEAVAEDASGTANATPSEQLVSETANSSVLLSQGEQLFFPATPDKEAGATAFAAKDWNTAIANYEAALATEQNDPEARIYYNNAKARQAGNPLTIAIVLPVTSDANEAKEMLRGSALYQEQFNQAASGGRLLELVLVDDSGQVSDGEIANDLANAAGVLGVLGHGATQETQQALGIYEAEAVAVVSPLNTEVIEGTGGQSILKTVPTAQKGQALLEDYLVAMNRSLLDYAIRQKGTAKVVLVYNSNQSYSMQQQVAFESAIAQTDAQRIQTLDLATNPDLQSTLTNLSQQGANTLHIALSKEDITPAVNLLQINQNLPNPLTTVAIDALYSPTLLVDAQAAVEDLVVAVPWRHEANQPFAQEAAQMWQGRVNWRTAAVFDALQALVTAVEQAPQRADATKLLNQGVAITGTNTDFNLLREVPLVQAVPGTAGPAGAKHQFDPI